MNIKSFVKTKVKQLCYCICKLGLHYQDQVSKKKLKLLSHNPEGGRMILPLPHRVIGAEYMTIGDNFYSLPGLRLECIDTYNNQHFSPKLIIGDNVTFNANCHVGVVNYVKIGNNALIGSYVLITDHSHGELERTSVPVAKRKLLSKGPVIIEDNVWIGEHACIMPGVTIGKGSIIGANAVVTHDGPPYSVAVGVPARVVKRL